MNDTDLLQTSAHLSWFQRHDEVFLYHDLIGYILGMSPDIRELVLAFGEPRTVADAGAHLGGRYPDEMLTELTTTLRQHRILNAPDVDELAALDGLFAVKARWRVAYTDDDGLVTLALSRTERERPRLRRLDAFESALFAGIDGLHSVRALADRVADAQGLTLEEALPRALAAMASWVHSDTQVVKLHELPLSFYDRQRHAIPLYLTSTMPYRALDTPTPNPQVQGAVVDLRDYHRDEISDPTLQFDEVETTLNHLFRFPHVALQGRTYPGQMLAKLVERGLVGPGPVRVLEVGGGTGSFAAGFLSALREEHPELEEGLSYTLVELSPALAANQRALLEPLGVRVVSGDIETLELPPGSVDLFIANEMIGDLRTALVEADDLESDEPTGSSPAEALACIRRHDLPVADAPDSFYINLGALLLVERLPELLAPGGAAVLTEFGEEHRYPVESKHLDHAEFSIHFGHLRHVARSVGLRAEMEFLIDFLDVERSLQTLATTRPLQRNLRALLAEYGVDMDKRVYTRADLQALCTDKVNLDHVESLQFDRIEDRVCGLVPHHFKILWCQRADGR